MQTIWQRIKASKGWRYERVEEGRGKRTGDLQPPFYVRPRVNGKQTYQRLAAQSFADAREEADKLGDVLDAAAKGLTVAEAENIANLKRTPIKAAVDDFLKKKASKAVRTIANYTCWMAQFLEVMAALRVKFLDEVTVNVLRKYKAHLERDGYAGKTIDTRYTVIREMLETNGNKSALPKDELPIVEEEPAVPYTEAELKKLFAAMNAEEEARYKFFLRTGCRDREVSFAAWKDIDFEGRKYHLRRKPDVGFTPKSHESRIVPLPASLVESLKARRKKMPDGRWIFVNTEGNPDNHFLRKLKQIARRAGLNCGICPTCQTNRECEHFILHRFRKTCATRWSEAGVPVRNIQAYLGHKSLETTQLYLGVTDTAENRKKIDTAFGD
jgi:integrase/recombinase XerD